MPVQQPVDQSHQTNNQLVGLKAKTNSFITQHKYSAMEVTATKGECGKLTLLQKTTAYIDPQSTTEYNNAYYVFFA